MGKLLRHYWQPLAAATDLDEEPVRKVRLLGEDLVLYRDRQGGYGLVEYQCPHRKASLAYGIPENEGLRCAYHGWMFDSSGQCIEQPAEDMDAPDSTFAQRTRIKAYPAQELGGMIFAYLGEGAAPLLPRYFLYVEENVYRSIGSAEIPCNWMQIMENSLDPTHVEWLHNRFDNYVLERLGKGEQQYKLLHHEKIGFDIVDYGIVKRRMWEGGSEEDEEWRVGHPIVFPNTLLNGRRGNAGFQIRVPIDDEHTMHWWYNIQHPPEGQTVDQDRPARYEVPVSGIDEKNRPTWHLLDNNSGQDMVMWYSQGPIMDRSTEKLGVSDKGVILYRKLLDDSIDQLERGEDPINTYRDPAQNILVRIPYEQTPNRAPRNNAGRVNTGASAKYDPVAQMAGMRQP